MSEREKVMKAAESEVEGHKKPRRSDEIPALVADDPSIRTGGEDEPEVEGHKKPR